MNNAGWIEINRDLTSWQWFDDPIMVRSFIVLLLSCATEETYWHGVTLRAGQFASTRANLAVLFGVTEQKVRTILSRLIDSKMIEVQTNNHFSIISVLCRKNNKINQPQQKQTEELNLDFQNESTSQQPAEKSDYSEEKTQEIKPSVFPFDAFWEMYGKKTDRKKCEVAYARIKEQERAKIKEHLPRYVEATPNKMYRKNPLTYLHGACWNDEITQQITNQNRNGIIRSCTFAENESGTGKQFWEP